MSKEAMKLALEALEYIEHNYMSLPAPAEKAITALREALAEQPAQTATYTCGVCGVSMQMEQPAQQKPLTDGQIVASNYPDGEENGPTIAAPDFELICFARQIEAAHGIKENT